MKQWIVITLATLFATGAALAQTPNAAGSNAESCEARAISKNGKPLAGAAKTAFMKKCEKGASGATSDATKTTAKSAQQEKMKTCNKEATGKKGDERKKFMSECLKG